jgi:hypothetical protein
MMDDFYRLNRGEKVAGISAVLLFVFMFFNWFGAEISGPNGSIDVSSSLGGSAWDTVNSISIFLLVTLVLTLGATSLRLSKIEYEPPIPLNGVLSVFGGISALLILYRIFYPPSFGEVEGVSVDGTLEFGVFLGLIAAAGIALGSLHALREERRHIEHTALPGETPSQS